MIYFSRVELFSFIPPLYYSKVVENTKQVVIQKDAVKKKRTSLDNVLNVNPFKQHPALKEIEREESTGKHFERALRKVAVLQFSEQSGWLHVQVHKVNECTVYECDRDPTLYDIL